MAYNLVLRRKRGIIEGAEVPSCVVSLIASQRCGCNSKWISFIYHFESPLRLISKILVSIVPTQIRYDLTDDNSTFFSVNNFLSPGKNITWFFVASCGSPAAIYVIPLQSNAILFLSIRITISSIEIYFILCDACCMCLSAPYRQSMMWSLWIYWGHLTYHWSIWPFTNKHGN